MSNLMPWCPQCLGPGGPPTMPRALFRMKSAFRSSGRPTGRRGTHCKVDMCCISFGLTATSAPDVLATAYDTDAARLAP
ncbi:hypothetical protein E2C01_055843 [Portunus trituberculatus]|uniref:Uncharacterized protein n=1 Tax=Portunus trituberculatus TaxID=210409 RepID=A0A5B7GY19_PORTR|nr:hypothetical protein [Portunus trituberculatus]